MLNLYESYYKLSADPFRLSPDHRFSFDHHSYSNAKAYLEYALFQGEGFITITGGAGTGKTTLISDILEGVDKAHMQVATLNTTQLDARDLLQMVTAYFGLQLKETNKATMLLALEQFLVQQNQRGHRCVLIVDEAQGLSAVALEELRMLANLQYQHRLLLQVCLVGQEKLRSLLSGPDMEHLRQRLIAAAHLEPLSAEETTGYVEHRLYTAGWQGNPSIAGEALRLIHQYSGGVPRRINLICNRLFLYGGLEQKQELGAADARHVIQELQRELILTADEPLAGENEAIKARFDEPDTVFANLPRSHDFSAGTQVAGHPEPEPEEPESEFIVPPQPVDSIAQAPRKNEEDTVPATAQIEPALRVLEAPSRQQQERTAPTDAAESEDETVGEPLTAVGDRIPGGGRRRRVAAVLALLVVGAVIGVKLVTENPAFLLALESNVRTLIEGVKAGMQKNIALAPAGDSRKKIPPLSQSTGSQKQVVKPLRPQAVSGPASAATGGSVTAPKTVPAPEAVRRVNSHGTDENTTAAAAKDTDARAVEDAEATTFSPVQGAQEQPQHNSVPAAEPAQPAATIVKEVPDRPVGTKSDWATPAPTFVPKPVRRLPSNVPDLTPRAAPLYGTEYAPTAAPPSPDQENVAMTRSPTRVASRSTAESSLNRRQIKSALLGGQWSSQGRPADLLPSEITHCNSEWEERITCWSIPQNIRTKEGLALYKVEATLQDFSAGGGFRLPYRTLVRPVGSVEGDESWKVTEHAMTCELTGLDKLRCHDESGVRRNFLRVPLAER